MVKNKKRKGIKLEDCKSCPLADRVENLEKQMEQIQSETKQNERAVTKLSKDLALHMQSSEESSRSIKLSISNLVKSLEKHMEDEKETIKEIKKHFSDTIKPINDKMKDFDGVKFRNGIMWAVGTSIGGMVLAGLLFVAQQQYTKYQKEQEFNQYSDKERMEYLKFKAKQLEKRMKANEESNN